MDKGKAPMTPGYEKRLKKQERRQPELLLGGMRSNQNNQQPVVQQKRRPPMGRMATNQHPGGAPMSLKEEILQEKRRQAEEHARELAQMKFNNSCRKFTTRRIRKGKDWVPTYQEVLDESERYPEVQQLYFDRLRRLGIPFSDARYNRYMAGITKECDALQKKLDAREEAEFWEVWGDVPNFLYDCNEKHTSVAADAEDDDEDYDSDYYVDITQD